MKPVIYTDLDDTLFTTLKGYRDADLSTLLRVTTAKNGNHSFMCRQRQSILNWIGAGATLVPVTARSLDAYNRVTLSADHFVDGAVLNNGALILNPDGSEDMHWSEEVEGHCAKAEPVLRKLIAALEAAPCDIRIHRHINGDVMLGMTVKSNEESEKGILLNLGLAEAIVRDCNPRGRIVTHRNGNNLAFVPNGVSKKSAVAYLMKTRTDLAGRPSIGAGDSLADLPFMSLCDMLLVPANTQTSTKLLA